MREWAVHRVPEENSTGLGFYSGTDLDHGKAGSPEKVGWKLETSSSGRKVTVRGVFSVQRETKVVGSLGQDASQRDHHGQPWGTGYHTIDFLSSNRP